MKKFFSDFKAFAMKGNGVDMAVGVIIGSAFGKIVTSLVNDIITPLISLAIGKMDLTGLDIVFRAGTVDPATGETVGKVALTYGNFIQSVIDFLIIAMCIFVVLRLITNAEKKIESLTKKKEEEKAEPTTKVCPFCKSEIAVDASRCPHCTSILLEETEDNQEGA